MSIIPNTNHPHSALLTQQEFDVSDAVDFITIKSGRDLETSIDYQKELLESFKDTLEPDIDTTVYKRSFIDGVFVMKKHEGNELVSKQILEQWITHNSIEIAEEFQDKEHSFKPKTIYHTKDSLLKLSRKASLNLLEVVQIIHLKNITKDQMDEEMDDTRDSMFRKLALALNKPQTENQYYESNSVLTVAANLDYPIPYQLVKRVKLPIDGVDWPRKSETSKVSKTDSDQIEIENTPKLLRIANAAWKKIWVDKAISEKPQQKSIIPWIEDKYSTTNREAKIIDQIIRPDHKKKGAIKK